MPQSRPVTVVVLPRPSVPLAAVAARGRHALAGLVALSIGVGLLGGPFAPAASASPVSSLWSATSGATLAKVGISAATLNVADVRVGPAVGTADSSTTRRVVADVGTLAANVAGLSVPVAVAHQEGPADNPRPS